MGWRRDWEAISARIDALTRAAEVYGATVRDRDFHSVQGKAIMPEVRALREALEEFAKAHRAELPAPAVDAFARFQASDVGKASGNLHISATLVVPLAILRAEVEYLVRDQHAEARSLTELAFLHLRRLIVVDTDVRKKWRAAFTVGEASCERLGALHLLHSGIWAFKVSTSGAATDLMFGDPIDRHAPDVKRTARALVATEWKRVESAAALDAKAAEARDQLKRYERGALADLVLTSTRFAVLVSKKDLRALDDVTEDGVTYRHVPIVVDPATPSVEARRISKRTRG